MKSLLALAIALSLTSCVGTTPESEEPADTDEEVGEAEQALPTSYCLLFEHDNHTGKSTIIPYGWDFNDLHSRGMGDNVTSLSCTAGSTIYVCEHKHWLGTCRAFSGSVANLKTYGLNDKLSSVAWQSPPLPQ